MIRTLAGALIGSLLVALPAAAQDAFAGTYSLEGKMGRRATAATLEITKAPQGDYAVKRSGKLLGSDFSYAESFDWTASKARRVGSLLIVDYRLSVAKGAAGAIAGTTQKAERYSFRGYYRTNSKGEVREYLYNYTKKGQWSFWRTTSTKGARLSDSLATLLHELRPLAKGLWYISESDAPLTPRSWAGQGDVDLAGFKRLLGVESARPAEETDFQGEYDFLTDFDPDGEPEEVKEGKRFKALFDAFRSKLTNLRIFRIADRYATPGDTQVDGGIHVYIAGKDSEGNLVVLETFSVET